MAIAIQPKFPIPNRTKQPIRSTKDQDGVIDIGWCDGVLSDGRAFRAEMWAQDQVSMLTVFFSTIGLGDLDEEAMKRFVEQEGLISFRSSGPSYCSAALFIDDGGNQVWSVNIVVGDEDQTYIDNSVPIFPYSRVGEPNTMFNPVPIKAAHQKPDPNAHGRFVWEDDDITIYSPEEARKAFPEAFVDDVRSTARPHDTGTASIIWEVTKQEDGSFIGRRSVNTPQARGTVFEVVQPGGQFFGIPYDELKPTCYKVTDGRAREVTVEDTLAEMRTIVVE